MARVKTEILTPSVAEIRRNIKFHETTDGLYSIGLGYANKRVPERVAYAYYVVVNQRGGGFGFGTDWIGGNIYVGSADAVMYGPPPEPSTLLTKEKIEEAIRDGAVRRAARKADESVRRGLLRLLPKLKAALTLSGRSLDADEAAMAFLEEIAAPK